MMLDTEEVLQAICQGHSSWTATLVTNRAKRQIRPCADVAAVIQKQLDASSIVADDSTMQGASKQV